MKYARLQLLLVLLCLMALSAAATLLVSHFRWTLYYGDAEAHLNIARRILDSRTPGYDQIGTSWLPLPHLFTLALVSDDRFWRRSHRSPHRRAIARQLLRLPLVWRPRIVNAAQDASIHQVSRGLFNFTVTFFAARHWSLRSQLVAIGFGN